MQIIDWNATIEALRQKIPQTQFQNWFQPLEFLRQAEGKIVLGVPSRFHEDWLKSHYSAHLMTALEQQCGAPLNVEFEVVRNRPDLKLRSLPTPKQEPQTQPNVPVVEAPQAVVQPKQAYTPPEFSTPPPFSHPYSEFKFNHVVFQCMGMFVEGKDWLLQTLLIQAPVGMGKTHALSEVATRLKLPSPTLRVRYTHAEAFSQELTMSLKSNQILDFKSKYAQQTDVLLFDDVHLLTRRMKTQEALLHIYNDMASRGGKIIFTSTLAVGTLEDFLPPLKSRLVSAVVAEVQVPSHEDKIALLTKIAEQNKIVIETGFTHGLAENPHTDLRELIGVLLRSHLQSKLENKPLSRAYLVRAGWSASPKQMARTMDEIIEVVENTFRVPRTDLMSKSRKGAVTWARQVAMYLARHYTDLPLEEIGKALGRDHATVIHSFQKVNQLMEAHPTKKYEVEYLKSKLTPLEQA